MFVYGEQGDRVRERELRTRSFVYLRPRARWFGFAFVTRESSLQRGLDHRWQAGIGVGRRLVETTRHRLRATVAVLRETARVQGRPAGVDGRVTLRLKGSHELGAVRLQEEIWWQPELGQGADRRLHAVVNVDATVTRWLAARVAVDEHYDTGLSGGLQPNDLRITVGVVLRRGMTP